VQLRGLLGAAYIAVTVVLAPRLGAAALIAALVAGQMMASLIVDHFGWVGFAQHAVTPLRLAGGAHRGRRGPGPPVAGGVASDPAA
jgi:bacterial/archaeal transporter family-2 protein